MVPGRSESAARQLRARQNGGFRDLTLRYHTDDPEIVDSGVNVAIAHDGTADNVKLQLASLATAFAPTHPR